MNSDKTSQDNAKVVVPSVGIVTCWLRSLEAKKPATERLVLDRFAERLSGRLDLSATKKWLEKSGHPVDFMVDVIAVRTRWIDDEIAAAAPGQLTILGAGLDARAYRLEALRGVAVFEVDFPKVLASKREILRADLPVADLRHVPMNLCTHPLASALERSGFVAGNTSLWLLDGLTGYLTAEELDDLLQELAGLAASGSKLVATFIKSASAFTGMHRSAFEDAADVEALLARHGWKADARSLAELAGIYRRAERIPESGWKYHLVTATRTPMAATSGDGAM